MIFFDADEWVELCGENGVGCAVEGVGGVGHGERRYFYACDS